MEERGSSSANGDSENKWRSLQPQCTWTSQPLHTESKFLLTASISSSRYSSICGSNIRNTISSASHLDTCSSLLPALGSASSSASFKATGSAASFLPLPISTRTLMIFHDIIKLAAQA